MYEIYYNPISGNYTIEEREDMLENNIAVGRAEKKWTQQQLADEVNVSRQTIVALEKNKYNPSLVLAFKIANSLEKDINDVFRYEEDK